MNQTGPAMPEKMLSWTALRELIGLSRTTVWRLRQEGRFPQPRLISNRHGWLASDIVAWQTALPVVGG
jgi:prophage regulatory protein